MTIQKDAPLNRLERAKALLLDWIRRTRWAWRLKMWPWQVPASVKYLSLEKPTERDLQRTNELARKYGWK